MEKEVFDHQNPWTSTYSFGLSSPICIRLGQIFPQGGQKLMP